jgi:hypothetical protein
MDQDSDDSESGSDTDFWETDEVGLPCQLLLYTHEFLSSEILHLRLLLH